MAKYAPGLQPDDSSINGWLSAMLFGVAAQHLSDQPTSQDLLNGLQPGGPVRTVKLIAQPSGRCTPQ